MNTTNADDPTRLRELRDRAAAGLDRALGEHALEMDAPEVAALAALVDHFDRRLDRSADASVVASSFDVLHAAAVEVANALDEAGITGEHLTGRLDVLRGPLARLQALTT